MLGVDCCSSTLNEGIKFREHANLLKLNLTAGPPKLRKTALPLLVITNCPSIFRFVCFDSSCEKAETANKIKYNPVKYFFIYKLG